MYNDKYLPYSDIQNSFTALKRPSFKGNSSKKEPNGFLNYTFSSKLCMCLRNAVSFRVLYFENEAWNKSSSSLIERNTSYVPSTYVKQLPEHV